MTALPALMVMGGGLSISAVPPSYDEGAYRAIDWVFYTFYLRDVNVAGGKPEYTYYWNILNNNKTVSFNPTAVSTSLITYEKINSVYIPASVPAETVVTFTLRCTVIDANSALATVDIPIRLITRVIYIGL